MTDSEDHEPAVRPEPNRDSDPDPEVRPIPPERRADFQQVVDYAFAIEEGPTDYDPDDPGAPDVPDRRGDLFGVSAGDDLRSVCAHYDLEARLRGEWVPLAGLASVATPPEHRREGHVRRLVAASLERWRDTHPLAALWPFDDGYYRQFGWATACKRVTYTCAPDDLAFAREAAAAPGNGRFRRLSADDWERLVDAHETHAADRTLTLRRDERWWRDRVFETIDGEEPYVYALEDADGGVVGYLTYTVSREDGDRRLRVRDLAFVDEAAYLRVLGFLADHDSQVAEVRFSREVGADLLDRVADPGAVDCEVTTGPMVRVVDVERALPTVPYPDGVEATLRLAVTDDTAPWNDGTFALAVEDGDAACERVERRCGGGGGGGNAEDGQGDANDAAPAPDARVDVRTLSQLVVGYHSVADARRLGSLDAGEAAAEALDALFPPETVHLRTFF